MQKEDAQQANLVHRTSEQTQAQPGPYSLPLREQLHPSITLYGMKDVVPSPLLSWLRSSTPFSFFGRGTVCKGRVSKSSPEMRGRGSVSTGFSSRSCPLFTEVVREGILSLAHWTKRRSRDRLEQPSIHPGLDESRAGEELCERRQLSARQDPYSMGELAWTGKRFFLVLFLCQMVRNLRCSDYGS